MPLRLRNITFDCAHPTELARWWTMVTGWEEDPGNPNLPEDDEAALVAPDRSLNLLFVIVPEAKDVKNRVHLDLQATDGTRDEEVVRLVANGFTNPEIAEQLHVAERTVKTYRARAIEKLGFSSRSELTAYARRTGLVE